MSGSLQADRGERTSYVRKLFYCAFAYLALALLLGAIDYHVGGAEKYRRLAQSHSSAPAVIEWTQCRNHGFYLYSFAVEGRRYTGSSNQAAEKPCGALRKGDALDVVYLPADPTINTNGDPRQVYLNAAVSLTVLALAVPAFIVIGLFRALSHIAAEDRKVLLPRRKKTGT